ncbi:MAG: hypothetical protein AABX98_04220 [Nanoarchaeota archaeon]
MGAIHFSGNNDDPIFGQREESIEAIVAQTEALAQRFDVDVELYFGNRELPADIAAQMVSWWSVPSLDIKGRHVETIISPRYKEMTPNGTKGMTYAVVGDAVLYFMLERMMPQNIPLFFDPNKNFLQYERQEFVDTIMERNFGNTFFAQH